MTIPEPLLSGARREYTVGHLVDMSPVDSTMPGERTLMNLVLPPWQRPEVWTPQQKQRLIESLFLGLGAGYYVTNGFEWDEQGRALPMSGWLLDGQQRLTAIRDFLRDSFPVFDGVLYSQLSRQETMRFLRQPFPCFQLNYTDNEEALKELYDRLNYGGTPHTDDQRVRSASLGQ